MKHLSVYVSRAIYSSYMDPVPDPTEARIRVRMGDLMGIFPATHIFLAVADRSLIEGGCRVPLFVINELKALVASKLQLA